MLRAILLSLVLAAPSFAQPYPLGHHAHTFQRSSGRIPAQGWDPSYIGEHEADKASMVKAVATYAVGLPGSLEPAGLGNTGCPANTTIDGPRDVAGLPRVTLTGVGAVPLIHDCNREGAALKVWNGMKVAVHGSAFRKID